MFRGGVCAAVLAALTAVLHAPAAAGQDAPVPAPAATPSGPVKSPGNAEWAKTPEEARARASSSKKLVYYEFESPNCGPCERMQALTYTAFDFEALLIGMVPVKVLYDSPESQPLQQRYLVNQTPSVLITTPEGRLVFLMQGFRDTGDFYQHEKQDLDRYRKFARQVESADVASLPAAEALSIGRELYDRTDSAAALPFLRRAASTPAPGPGVRESALEGLAAVELQAGDPAASRQAIDALIATTKDPAQKERAALFRAQIPLAENKPSEALALYRQFARDYPNSPYLDRVKTYIAKLEAMSRKP